MFLFTLGIHNLSLIQLTEHEFPCQLGEDGKDNGVGQGNRSLGPTCWERDEDARRQDIEECNGKQQLNPHVYCLRPKNSSNT